MEEKQCRRCWEWKPVSEFHKSSRLPDGYQTWCHKCINEYKMEWRESNRSEEEKTERNRVIENKELVKQDLKRCIWCGEIKPIDEFWIGEGAGGTRSDCSECDSKRFPDKNVYNGELVNKHQRRAVKAVFDAISMGLITRPSSCPICGKSPRTISVNRIQFHHTNGYNKEYVFFGLFLCGRCHRRVHQGVIKVEGREWLPESDRLRFTARRMASWAV